MQKNTGHHSVLLNESISALNIQKDGIYVDATFGRGGHSERILDALQGTGKLIAIDRDLEAKKFADVNFTKYQNFEFVHSSFSELSSALQSIGIHSVDGILMDIGVSSPQLDDSDRGFSFMQDGPLDMRMNQKDPVSASHWVMTTSFEEMVRVFKVYGEERFAVNVARNIEKIRIEKEINSTQQLVDIITESIPFRDRHKHPATRVFQAIRIAVNNELEELESVLVQTGELLNKKGRLVVISFHSLEDRIVKNFMRDQSTVKDLFPDLPILITDGTKPAFKVLGKAIKASKIEQDENIRSRSAVLRIAEKI